MKRYLKVLALVSTFILAIMIAGCGDKTVSNNETTGDTEAVTEQEQNVQTEAESETSEEATEDENGEADEDSEEDMNEEAFVGNWTDANGSPAILSIYSMRGDYYADITWNDGADEDVAWSMECKYDEASQTLTYSNGVKSRNIINDEGNMEGEGVYEDGTGSFTYSDGAIYWHDNKEDAGKSFEFRR